MTNLPTLLLLLLIAAFCVGAGVFYRVATRRSSHVALIGWGLCGAAVMALGWGAYAAQVGPSTAIFTGLVLPAWLFGGLIGMFAGLFRQAWRK